MYSINLIVYLLIKYIYTTPILNYFYGQQQAVFTMSKIRTYLRT